MTTDETKMAGPLVIASPTRYVDQFGRVVVHNRLVTREDGATENVTEFVGNGVVQIDQPVVDPQTKETVWQPRKHETYFHIPVRPAIGKSQPEAQARLLAAFRGFNAALAAKAETLQKEVRDFVAEQERVCAAIKEAEAKAAAEAPATAPAPSGLIVPGSPAPAGKLIIPGGQPERIIQRGQE